MVVLAVTFVALGLLAAPQSSSTTARLVNRGPSIEKLERWLAAVERHQIGTTDASAVEIGKWRGSDLVDLWIEVSAVLKLMHDQQVGLFFVNSDGRRIPTQVLYTRQELDRLRALAVSAADRGGPNRLLKEGAVLHTDIASASSGTEALTATPSKVPREFTVNLPDGRQTGLDERAAHWTFARTLLDAVAPNPSRDETVRLWYRATITFMQSQAQLYRAHIDHALQLFSNDAELVFLAGCLHESLAGPRIQAGIRSAALPPGTSFNVASPREEWQQADALFRRALAIEPALTESRLHLGRVLGLLGRHADAAKELDRVVAAVQEPLLRYYASLFLGAEAEALGDREKARASYADASALFPRAQAPRLALSQLAAVQGDRGAAMTAIQPVLTPPADEEDLDDPWWMYHIAQGRTADARMSQFRARWLTERAP